MPLVIVCLRPFHYRPPQKLTSGPHHTVYSWSIAGTLSVKLAQPIHAWGFVALLAVDALYLFSTEVMRRRFYGTFIVMHVLGVVTFLVALWLHSSDAASPYILMAIAVYMLDRLCRLVKTRYTTARLTALPELGMTRVEVHGVNAGWRAGQHVRLRVLSRGLGLFGWAECHPFTIASVSKVRSAVFFSPLPCACQMVGTRWKGGRA